MTSAMMACSTTHWYWMTTVAETRSHSLIMYSHQDYELTKFQVSSQFLTTVFTIIDVVCDDNDTSSRLNNRKSLQLPAPLNTVSGDFLYAPLTRDQRLNAGSSDWSAKFTLIMRRSPIATANAIMTFDKPLYKHTFHHHRCRMWR
jgi:hypothetical protein